MLVAKVPNNKNCSGDTKECGVGPTVNIDEIYIDAGFEQCDNSKLFSLYIVMVHNQILVVIKMNTYLLLYMWLLIDKACI